MPDGWAYRVLYPAVGLVAGSPPTWAGRGGTPSFRQTVVYDPRSARLLRRRTSPPSTATGSRRPACCARRWPGCCRACDARPLPRTGRRGPVTGHRAAVRAVRDLLADRLADPPSLDDLALAAGMSPFALVRAFRAETGLPPHAYLNQLRVRLARRLLDAGAGPGRRGGRGRLRRPGRT